MRAISTLMTVPGMAMAEKTLRGAVFLPKQMAFAEPAVLFADKLNEIGEGVIQLDLVGPDAIPANEQPNALRSGRHGCDSAGALQAAGPAEQRAGHFEHAPRRAEG